MNLQINQLVKSLLKKETLEQCSLQELEQFANRHPYFGAAQLLLTKKLQAENPERYDEQLQKTFLFFHNPLWVEHLLNETGNAEIVAPAKKEEVNLNPEVVAQTEIAEIPSVEAKEQKLIQTEQVLEMNVEPSLDIPKLKMETIDMATAELSFEPFHTVDYFASQGIKFKEEEKPKDKFGQQLKSFTDWLKTMKRLPISEVTKSVEVNLEISGVVEQLAEHSIEDRDVITEAMAEVWEKQGNMDKAINIYNKLSLLDPSKSLYFAAKIEDLKKTN